MRFSVHTAGYSLVEVLVSIAVLLLAILGPMSIASQGIKSAQFALEQNTAFFLAQEGIEAIFALRGNAALEEIDGGADAWSWMNDLYGSGVCSGLDQGSDPCSFGIDFRSSTVENNMTSDRCDGDLSNCRLYKDEGGGRAVFTHQSSGGAPSQFIRVVTVEALQSYAVKVTSTVYWNSHAIGGQQQSITLTTFVFDTTL